MENLKINDFINYKYLSNMNFSPNGEKCAFIVHQMDTDKNCYLSSIHLINSDKQIQNITSLDQGKSYLWKTDKSILFPSIKDEKDKERKKRGEIFTSYYQICLDSGEVEKAFEIPLNVNDIKKIDDDNYLMTAIINPGHKEFEDLFETNNDMELKETDKDKSFQILDEIPFWSNGEGYNNKRRSILYLYNVSTEKLSRITDLFSNINHYALNKDKSYIVFITSSYIDKMSTKTSLNIYDIKENKYEKISPFREFDYSYCEFLEDKVLFIGNNMKSHGLNENSNIYITDFTGSFPKKISNSDYSFWNSIVSDCTYGETRDIKIDNDFLYYISTEKSNSFIYKIDIHGNTKRLTAPKGTVDDFDISDGKLYFIGMRGLKLQEIYELNRQEFQLTNFNTWIHKKKKISKPEKKFLPLDNGSLLEGWVLKPVDFVEGKKYPAILNIHGGPKTAYGEIFSHEMQCWSNNGYFVFYCNPRGSDGYGDEFADIRGKYGTIDYEDIMNFTDLVLKNYPAIDKNLLGVTGGSYGGFLTNWIIGHTSRFKAAVSQRSISNWISFFGMSDIGYFFTNDQISSNPWVNFEKLWFHSPLKYADNVTTPTLFIHSEEDYRCPISEGLQMFTALKYHGVDSRLIAFKGENHDLSRLGKPKNRIKRLEEITTWFDKYLK